MATEPPLPPLLPNFISSFASPTPFFFFYHTINAEDTTLRIDVIGPGLTFTFKHSKQIGRKSLSEREISLQEKTVGFLTVVRGDDRHVLKWAESGNGAGKKGDFLDVPPKGPVLANLIWTRRVVKIATLLGVNLTTPFDAMGQRGENINKENKGVFKGCHVEVKLAVFAIYLMLKTFGIIKDFSNITRGHLRQLRKVRWEDGTRPEFEIYFSRKNCGTCGKLARVLSEITGISIKLEWRDRLTKKVYPQKKVQVSKDKETPRIVTIDDDDEIVDMNEPIVIEDDSDSSTDTIFIDSDDEDDGIGGNGATVNLLFPENTPSPDVEVITAAPEVQQFIQAMTEYTDKVDTTPAAPLRSAPVCEPSTQTDKLVKKPLPATPVEADKFPDFDFDSEPQRWTPKRDPPSGPRTPPSGGSETGPSVKESSTETLKERSKRKPKEKSKEAPKETPQEPSQDLLQETLQKTRVESSREPVAELQERTPRQYRLQSENGQLLTPETPVVRPFFTGKRSNPTTDSADTPTQPPIKKQKTRSEDPLRKTSRSPSPFSF